MTYPTAFEGGIQVARHGRTGWVGKKPLLNFSSVIDLIQAMRDHGIGELFPDLSPAELQTIADDGKIPQHHRWGDKIMRRELAVDSLMTLAGLAHFATSQQELDQRIREHLS